MMRLSAPAHSLSPRRAVVPVGRRFALVAAVALAVAACGSDSATLPVFRVGEAGSGAVNAAADAPAESMSGDAAKMSMVAWLDYELGAELPAFDGEAEGWTLSGADVDEARIAEMAGLFGVPGDVVAQPVDMGGGWSVGSTDGTGDSFWASADGPGWWSYSAAWDDSRSGYSCSEVMVDPLPAPDSGSGEDVAESPVAEPPATEPSGAESAGGSPAAPSDETATGGVVTVDEQPTPCVEPAPPQNVPTSDEAQALFQQMLSDLGVATDGLAVEVYADEWSASVYATREVDGMPTPLSWSASYGADSEVTYANGSFAEPVSIGMLPRIGTDAAFERLASDDGGWWSMTPMVKSAVADGAVEPAGVESSPPADMTTSDVMAPDALPTESEPVPAEPITVTIVDVEESLWSVWDVDSTVWLVPAYDFIDADGGRHTVPAVPDEMIDTTGSDTSDTSDTMVPVTEPAVEPGDEPGDDSVVSDTSVIPTMAPPEESVSSPEFPGGVESLVGLVEADALDTIAAAGFETRVVARDGEYAATTADYRLDRVNLEIVDGAVTAASIG